MQIGRLNYDFTKTEWMIVLGVGLGYFCDLADLLLFGAIRVKSLMNLGLSGEALTHEGLSILHIQLIGVVVGGFLWGILSDYKGRKSVLFWSIALYTSMTFLNAFVTDVTQYKVVRLLAGIGLAGELGIGITVATEMIRKDRRTEAITLISAAGMLGAVSGALIGEFLSWKLAFMIVGSMGLLVFIFRTSIPESLLFEKVRNARRNFLKDLSSIFFSYRIGTYFLCVLIGFPVFQIVIYGISQAPEFGRVHNLHPSPTAGWATAVTYFFIFVGDLLSGYCSKRLASRKKVIIIFLLIQLVGLILFIYWQPRSLLEFYSRCAFLGIGIGYWSILVTNAAEQFPTSVRATVTTSVPNLVRGSAVLTQGAFNTISESYDISAALMILGVSSIAIALAATFFIRDKYEVDASLITVKK